MSPAAPIRFLDLQRINLRHEAAFQAALRRVLDSGWFILGPETEAFESEFAASVGAPHAVGVGNGLDALKLALQAHGIGPGDEVIVPAHTFVATWLAVMQVGARPVPVEPDPCSLNIDPAGIAERITPRTRAVMPVHLYGLAADLEPIRDIAHRHHLAVVEDAAQAHGATYQGRRIGSHGTTAAWSFYPGKNLGALGDGGAITTHDPQLAQRLRMLRNYGSARKYEHELPGCNSRLDEIQCAFLRERLRHLDTDNDRRRQIVAQYLRGLAGTGLKLPPASRLADSAWHLFVVQASDRDGLAARLAAEGIQTQVHYPRAPHLQPACASLGIPPGAFPLTERLQDTLLSLPLSPVQTDAQTDAVIAALRRHVGTAPPRGSPPCP